MEMVMALLRFEASIPEYHCGLTRMAQLKSEIAPSMSPLVALTESECELSQTRKGISDPWSIRSQEHDLDVRQDLTDP
jgi:hypothetical protein